MPLVDAYDKGGNKLSLDFLDGVFFPIPPFADSFEDHYNSICYLALRYDDVFICAYPKCGTHWVWEMVQMLRSGEARYERRTKETMMVDFMTPDMLDAVPSPRTLNSHCHFRFLPKQVAQKKHKIIHVNRDPRDVAVSFFNHLHGMAKIAVYTGKFEDYLSLFQNGTLAFGSWFEHTKDWERIKQGNPDIPILSLFYEEMKKKPVEAVKQLAEFLDISASDALCQDIARACSFQELKAAHHTEKDDPLQSTWKEGHPGVYRKGEVGDWTNWFTEAQQETFNEFYTLKMADCGNGVFERYLTGTSKY